MTPYSSLLRLGKRLLLKKVSLLKNSFSSAGFRPLKTNKLLQFMVSKRVSFACLIYAEATINMVLRLCGGKKKRKKKIYTKPKKIGHKHKKRPKALLEYFNVDNTGKISKLKIECPRCPPGKFPLK